MNILLKLEQQESLRCECGSVLKKKNIQKHFDSQKHKKYVYKIQSTLYNTCECGALLKKINKKHLNSKQHIKYVEKKSNEKIRCDCGSLLIKITKQHLLTKKHIEHTSRIMVECDICYNEELDTKFYNCKCCRHEYCLKCYSKIDKCPFCRTRY